MCYEVLVRISPGYPSVTGRLHTRYSPVRRSPSVSASWYHVAPRLACVRPVASVHPEPGSNSSLYDFFLLLFHNLLARDGDFYSSRTTFLSIVISSRIACFFHSKTDCKSKGFILILQKKSLFFHYCPSLPKSVCKSKNFHSYLQIFSGLFLYTYNKYLYNCLQITYLYTKLFSNKKLHKTEIIFTSNQVQMNK